MRTVAAARPATAALASVAITRVATPLGELLLASGGDALLALALPGRDEASFAEGLERRLGAPVGPGDDAVLVQAAAELEEYFAGVRTDFAVPLDWRLTTPFRRRILEQAIAIPYGETATYGQLAARAGHPGAGRAAGTAMSSNPIAIIGPCHRVLPAGRGVGAYGGGADMKQALLDLERAGGRAPRALD